MLAAGWKHTSCLCYSMGAHFLGPNVRIADVKRLQSYVSCIHGERFTKLPCGAVSFDGVARLWMSSLRPTLSTMCWISESLSASCVLCKRGTFCRMLSTISQSYLLHIYRTVAQSCCISLADCCWRATWHGDSSSWSCPLHSSPLQRSFSTRFHVCVELYSAKIMTSLRFSCQRIARPLSGSLDFVHTQLHYTNM